RTHDCLGDGQSLRSRLDLDPQCDYETELGVILAKELPPGSPIDESVIFGFTIINDYTSRLFQKRYKQWSLGKSIDTYCAMGPVIATLDEFKDPFDLAIRGYKNNVLVQDSRTSLLRRGIFDVIRDLNQGMTLHRCDVIATGTPAGVAVGKNDPDAFLKPGDVFRCEIEGLGKLENPVV
ncbi:MAG: fumarylacetoacetate hydrolase family protein, partial [Spirochaetales bacterium]|nr:fumarylacetoacetate hydrolase family protein [Spirochaetales bacterium]